MVQSGKILKFEDFNRKTILIADLDGTVIKTKSGKKFPVDENDWIFKNGFLKAITNFNPTMFHIVSNQGGIEKGTTDEQGWNRKVLDILREISRTLKGKCQCSYDYCTTNNKKDRKRKPNTGMLEDFFNAGFDVESALMIGDASGKQGDFSDSDLKTAENFGIDYMDIDEFISKYK